jgi:hypothetical protein
MAAFPITAWTHHDEVIEQLKQQGVHLGNQILLVKRSGANRLLKSMKNYDSIQADEFVFEQAHLTGAMCPHMRILEDGKNM